jgi:hypothetical protein
MRSQFQMLGFYLAGFVCLMLAGLKLRIDVGWSWWRVLLPLRVALGHNALYIAVGFVWLTFTDDGTTADEVTIHQSDGSDAYQLIALLCFLLFADNLLERIEGTGEAKWFGLRSGWWTVIVASGVLSVMCQLLLWSTVIPTGAVAEPGKNSGQSERWTSLAASKVLGITASMSFLLIRGRVFRYG